MTVWITDQLTKSGIPDSGILWNVSEAGEEVDLLVEFLGQLWIFELKDREFGSGDAYALNYRQVRYRANGVFVVTTEKVSKEAKRVFEELAREARRDWSGPVYVEGLDAAPRILRDHVSVTALQYALRRLAFITDRSGYDIAPIIAARFNQPLDIALSPAVIDSDF